VCSLLEVHVGNAVAAHVVVLDNAELGARNDLLDKLLGCLDIVFRGELSLRLRDGPGAGVVGEDGHVEVGDVHAALGHTLGLAALGVGSHLAGQACNTNESLVLHAGL
jgi:hypothetical protein